jgi:hypothetical protein
MEYCEHGSLKDYLLGGHVQSETARLAMATDCALGLAYFARRNFVHRDVAARNVLVTSLRQCKISGESRVGIAHGKKAFALSLPPPFPVRWMRHV